MSQYKLNIIPFTPARESVSCVFTNLQSAGFDEIPTNCLPVGVSFDDDSKTAYWKIVTNPALHLESDSCIFSEVSFKENIRFSKFFFAFILFNQIKQFDLKTKFNFISAPQYFIPTEKFKYTGYKAYKKFTVRVLTNLARNPFSIMVSYDGYSYVSNKSAKALDVKHSSLATILFDNKNFTHFDQLNPVEQKQLEKIYPVLNRDLMTELKIDVKPDRITNKYIEYYEQITQFTKDYLLPEQLATWITLNPSLFFDVPHSQVEETSPGSNILEFGNDGSSFSPYHGLKENGPFQPPLTQKIKLIFLFHQDDSATANKLASYLKKGYKSFPGLYEFAKIPVDIDAKNSIKYTSLTNPSKDIKAILNKDNLEAGYQYAAIYISRIKKRDPDDEKESQYYKIKELLLQNSITSQVIYKENIENSYFNFYLPNIAIALLAKLGGIPWRLKRPKKKDLLIGIGAYQPQKSLQRYLGNAFYFKNDGTFHEFDCFEDSNVLALTESYKKSILNYISENGNPGRLIIHFYKTVSREDVRKIQMVLAKLSLSIPVIIVTIKKTEHKDLVMFDTSYDGLMPVSGSYLRISKDEFLLSNNSRHSKLTGSNIDGFPFPIKLRVFSTDPSFLSNSDLINELVDQVYQFSRMYWKSVKQKSLPVTIEYSEMVAEVFSKFDASSLPEFGKRNLWFL